MKAELIAKYLNAKRIENNLTYSAIAEICKVSESTVKGLCLGKTDNPSMATIGPIMDAVGGSFDEMFHPEKTKDEVKEASVLALKDVYEFQIASMKETHEEHIKNIREHYERHIHELKEQYEKHINTIMIDKKWFRLASVFSVGALVALFLFIEFLSPGHGWLKVENNHTIFPYIIGLVSIAELVVLYRLHCLACRRTSYHLW